MKINKVIKDKVKVDYLLLKGTLDIDSNYFIKKIDEGIKKNNNRNFQTNVKGYMTSWDYFIKDANFIKILLPLFDYLDGLENIKPYCLEGAWGLKEGFGNYTEVHDHAPNYFSGIIYLNDHSQTLLFPELNEEFKPRLNSFIIFSSFLSHKTIRNITNVYKYAISFNLNHSTFKKGN
tara:strand:- start:229 stop:759 length:531 start_codon:yes stop_codon:yes gene_type:complete